MKLKSLNSFTCFPDGKTPMDVAAGKEFEIEDQAYADMLVKKGHAEVVSSQKAAPAPAPAATKGDA